MLASSREAQKMLSAEEEKKKKFPIKKICTTAATIAAVKKLSHCLNIKSITKVQI